MTKLEIENFLGVPLPPKLILPEAPVRVLDKPDLESLLLERKPFFLVDKAVVIGKELAFAVVTINPEQCAGHFPGRPIVPLIRMCEATAQTGVILVAANVASDHAPIAIGSGSSEALTKSFVEPPVTLLIEVKKISEKFGALFVIEGKIYVKGDEVAQLKGIKYLAPHKSKVVPMP